MKQRFRLRFSIRPHLLRSLALLVIPAIALTVQQIQAQEINAQVKGGDHSYEFETASIKLNKDHTIGFLTGFTPDGFRGQCVNLKWLVQQAYDLKSYDLAGVPDWMNSECYDMEAKFGESVIETLKSLPKDELKSVHEQMLQKLLADRFGLKTHKEDREQSVYLLVVGKDGPKLQEGKETDMHPVLGPDGQPLVQGRMEFRPLPTGGDRVRGYNVSTSILADFLVLQLSRPVLDKTGLTGSYTFTLEWTPDAIASPTSASTMSDTPQLDAPSASIFSAVQQQLGLKLEAAKAPVPVMVIDHIERPSPN